MFSIFDDVSWIREACFAESFLYSLLSKQLLSEAPVIAKLSTDCITSGGGFADKACVPENMSNKIKAKRCNKRGINDAVPQVAKLP